MKAFLKDFKEFINRGGAVNVAVGIIIGGALTSIVHSFLSNVVNPLIAAFGSICFAKMPNLAFKIPGTDHVISFGAFLSDILNFLLIALVVFCIIRAFIASQQIASKAARRIGITNPDTTFDTPAEQTCPYCQKKIPAGALRCSYCTSVLSDSASLKSSAGDDRMKHRRNPLKVATK